MRTYLDCIPCFYRQALEAARKCGVDEECQKKVLDCIPEVMAGISLEASPPEIAREVYAKVHEICGDGDPYLNEKDLSNKLAMDRYGEMSGRIASSKDPLLTAVELAIVGNIIDHGVKNSLNVEKELEKILESEEMVRKGRRVLFDYDAFRRELESARKILYLGDNAGEVVFDRLLVETIKDIYGPKDIIYAVKEKPVINDALIRDAVTCGIDKCATVISNGSDAPGTVLSLCSAKFKSLMRLSDMVISKGQGNFESLSDEPRKIYFLFMAKCPVVAKSTGGSVGEIILTVREG